ncbi:hypothetical protein A2961_00505 [Candidatus Woesebacteria bacterium RIFCSPLOWO2_01_FULL_39_21]|uniref:Uncharacterized protein n=1 Tax=Candidatus Woesebacteria bacterium RIFCSPLOWO2_01_FULL_39_21 TaxID=1802519 RepID=A0A1F8BCU8_9BACT|nr:MAG: hypothetical protein A2691_00425 [Candidatus Woesebacteria bacterium RIFCSPHIGHO2_01_FULL_39_23]OGM61185.1 MAG: hypothetical protein A2961_00505 [Candidatus Woesebacteria bacterium RIFCSPLOWO2_01_FULL_39_21]
MKIWDDKGGVYETKPVTHLINKYLKLINISPKEFWVSKDIPIIFIRYILLFSIDDYKENNISLDNLSTIAGDLYWGNTKLWNPNNFFLLDSKLARLLDELSELSFNNWKGNKKYVSKTLKESFLYLKGNKDLIQKNHMKFNLLGEI